MAEGSGKKGRGEEQAIEDRPLLLITMGDPAGVGPEVVLKALTNQQVVERTRPVVLGDRKVLEALQPLVGTSFRVKEVAVPREGDFSQGVLNLIPLSDVGPLPFGQPRREGGEAAYRYIVRAVELLLQGEAEAMVTAPISKVALRMAGHPWNGHTELLAELARVKEYAMMLAGPRLRVSLVTTHVPLSEVPRRITSEGLLCTITVTHKALRELFGIEEPKLAVAALNPHAGEGGLLGREEEEVILPALKRASERGITAEGPFPADALFYHALQGRWDAVVAMYHDQGLIPLKMLHFREGVNITLGLPFIRTSVDHGTAYDIAGKALADPTSMISAIEMAADFARRRRCSGISSSRSGSQ